VVLLVSFSDETAQLVQQQSPFGLVEASADLLWLHHALLGCWQQQILSPWLVLSALLYVLLLLRDGHRCCWRSPYGFLPDMRLHESARWP
jgi:hypothetical protein